MKPTLRFAPILVGLLLVSSSLLASGPAGVICIVDKVVFEPSEAAPQRIQIWGAFSIATSNTNIYGPARAGYMYFSLPSTTFPLTTAVADIARKEWTDLKAIAGTGTAVGFGMAWSDRNGTVRDGGDKPNSPDTYIVNSGLVKIQGNQSIPGVASSNGVAGLTTKGGIVDQLCEALKKSQSK